MKNGSEWWISTISIHFFLWHLISWRICDPGELILLVSRIVPHVRRKSTDLTGCAAWRAHLFLGPFPQVPSRAFHQCHDRFEPSLVRLQESQESHWNSRSLGEARFLSSPSHLTWQSEPSAVLWYMVSHPSFEIQEFAVPRCTAASDLRNSSRTRSELWGRHGYQILDDLSFKSLYVAQDSFQGIWM